MQGGEQHGASVQKIFQQAAAAVDFGPSLPEEKHDQRIKAAELAAVDLCLSLLKEKKYVADPIHLKRKDFEDFGWTRGCARCDRMRRFRSWRSRSHSQQCRDRIINELAKTTVGQLRIANVQARKLFEKMLEK